MEETGYAIHGIRRLGMFHRFTYMPEYDLHAQKQCHIYTARLGPRRSEPTEDGHSAVFLPWEVACERLAVSGDRHFVAHWMKRRVASDRLPSYSTKSAEASSGKSDPPGQRE
jgi:8-oxo-dGTP diphosphatase